MERAGSTDSLDLALPSDDNQTSNVKKDASDEQKGNSYTQSNTEVSVDEEKNPDASSDTDGSPSKVTVDQEKETLEDGDQQQKSDNSQKQSTNSLGKSLETQQNDETKQQIDVTSKSDSENNQIIVENSPKDPSPLREESANIVEKSDTKSNNIPSDSVCKESGNDLDESENVLGEVLTSKIPDETPISLPEKNSEAQSNEDSNSCKKNEDSNSREKNEDSNLSGTATKSKNDEDPNSSHDSASRILFEDLGVVTPKKSSVNVEISNKNDQPDKQANDEISSGTTSVEQNLSRLFSDTPLLDINQQMATNDGNESISNSDTNAAESTYKNLQIKDVISCKENVSGLNTSIKDENCSPEKDSKVDDDFHTNHEVHIKEEIESIWFENSNSVGFDNEDSSVSYTSDQDQLQETMLDLCRKECFVLVKRCDDSLLNVANPYKSNMKKVSVESLSSLNLTEKNNIVWSYFIKKTPTLAECKICGRTLLYRKLYNLTRHLQTVHDHNSTNNYNNDALDESPSLKRGRSKKVAIASSSMPANDPTMFKQQPMNYFSFVNSQTARCKLCSQYMPYRSIDDLAILKSHLLLKHSDDASSRPKRSVRIEKPVSTGYEDEEDEEEEKPKRKPRMRTWAYFTKLDRGVAQCNICQRRFHWKFGNLCKLTAHLIIGHNINRPGKQSKTSPIPSPQKKQKVQPVKKKTNPQVTQGKNSKDTSQSPTGKQFLKFFSFLRSDNALCKKCNTKVPFNNKDTKSLLNHYNKCTPEVDSGRKRTTRQGKVVDDDVADDDDDDGNDVDMVDDDDKDPDFVPEDPLDDGNKTRLMAAVELSPKDDDTLKKHFKQVSLNLVQCVHCSKRLALKKGDTWLLEQHLQLWHGFKSLPKIQEEGVANLDDIPLLFRLKNQPKPYTLGDCYSRKKLQYNLTEIGRYYRRAGNNKLICKLCTKHINCNETSTELLMSHILQEHVRKLFKPKPEDEKTSTVNTTVSPVKQTPVKQPPVKQTPTKMKSTPPPTLTTPNVQAQSTPLPTPRRAPKSAAKPKGTLKMLANELANESELNSIVSKSNFTMKYYLEYGANRQQCKLCTRQFAGKKTLNIVLLTQHLLTSHMETLVDDETQLAKADGNEQRKAIIRCTRRRIVNKFSKTDNSKITCKICAFPLDNAKFESMKSHLLRDHKKYLITVLKEVKRILNYNTTDMRKTKRLLSTRKKLGLRAKCSVCSREVRYTAGNTKHLLQHLLKLHKTKFAIPITKLKVWKYFTRTKYSESKCEICSKFISSKIHCNHKVPKLFCLTTGLKTKPRKELKSKPETESTELVVKDKKSPKKASFYFSALKQFNSECIFCSKSLKSANKIICKIACRFNHGNEYINWLYKNDPVDKTFVSGNQIKENQKTLSLLEMFEELKNRKMNSIKLWYSEFSNKYHCNLCSDTVDTKYVRFCLYFDHALVKHKGLLSMHRPIMRPYIRSGEPPINSQTAAKTITKSPIPTKAPLKNTKLVKVKLWNHFKVTGAETACCNFCKIKLQYTSTNVDKLSTHLRVQHLNDLLKLSEQAASSPQPQPQPPTTPTPAPKPAAATASKVANSSTWNYFTESKKGAKCKLCGKQFLFTDKTQIQPLTKHLQLVHSITLSQDGQPPAEQNHVSKEQQTKWAWQYFEKDNVRPSTAKCKLCAIYCSCVDEQADLASVLLKHLRLVHNKWLVIVGDNLISNNLISNNLLAAAKRPADTASSPGQKKVKFDDSILDDNTSMLNSGTPSPNKTLTPSKPASGQATAPKAKKSLKSLQEQEKTKSKKSLVWTYFTPIEGQPDFSRCNVCSKSISSKFGISILRTHLRVKHNILIVNMNQYSELKKSIGDTSLTKSSLSQASSAKQAVTPAKTGANSNKSVSDKSHPVWSYFKEEKNSNLMKCNLCSVYLSCKSEKAESLQNHLSAKHNIVFLEADPLKNDKSAAANKSLPDISSVAANKSMPDLSSSAASKVEKKAEQPLAKSPQKSPMTAKELYESTRVVEESVVENEVFYTTEDNLVTVTDRGDPSADETVHYEIVETTQHSEPESTDIVKVITELLPSYSVGISDDVNATEISPQESDLISNIVTSLSSNAEEQIVTQQAIIDGDQLKSIAVLTGETEDTSLAWDFYVKLSDSKVKCDVCSEVFTYENKESANLTEHIQAKHPAELAQYKLSRLGFSDSCIIVVKNSN